MTTDLSSFLNLDLEDPRFGPDYPLKELSLDPGYGLTDVEIDDFAKNTNLEVVEPKPNQVQVDIDSKIIPKSFYEQLSILKQFETVKDIKTTTSRSGNKHVTVTFGRHLLPPEQLLYAALLGSDLKREALNAKNFAKHRPRPIFFYEVQRCEI